VPKEREGRNLWLFEVAAFMARLWVSAKTETLARLAIQLQPMELPQLRHL
jgi:hypothetical protein